MEDLLRPIILLHDQDLLLPLRIKLLQKCFSSKILFCPIHCNDITWDASQALQLGKIALALVTKLRVPAVPLTVHWHPGERSLDDATWWHALPEDIRSSTWLAILLDSQLVHPSCSCLEGAFEFSDWDLVFWLGEAGR